MFFFAGLFQPLLTVIENAFARELGGIIQLWVIDWGFVGSDGSRRYGCSYSGTQLGHSTRASSTTMETRCPKSSFQTFQKRNRLEIRSYRCYGEHGEKMFVFLGLFVHAAVRGGTCAFTLKIVNTLIKNSSRGDRPSIST